MNVLSNSQYTENFQTFAVTHSNHIINYSTHNSNSSIYSIKKLLTNKVNSLPNFQINNISYGDTSVLDLIGANKSSVFLANCSIWVEGVTDKMYLSKIIDTYLNSTNCKPKYKHLINNIKEGLHYIFVYSSGDNIIHLDFENDKLIDEISEKVPIKFLCGKALVIIDDDNNKNPERKKALKRKLNFDLLILNASEIENLLSPHTILNTVKSYPSVNKHNLNINPNIDYNDYRMIKLGTYIDDVLLPKLKKENNKKHDLKMKSFRKDKNSSNSTLNNKVEFCKYAILHIDNNPLTKESINVAESILEFIKRNNPHL